MDTFVLGKVGGDVVLGFYSMAKTLASLPVLKISVVVNQLTLPMMAGIQADRSALRASFLRALRLVAALTFPLCSGAALVTNDLVWITLGAKWQPMVPLIRVLCVFGLIHSLAVLLPPVLLVRYRAAFLFWWTCALLLVMPLVFWTGATWLGGLGVALGWITVYPLMLLWMAGEGLRELGVGWRSIWSEMQPIIRATLMMVGVVLTVLWAVPGLEVGDRVLRLALASAFGALVYGPALFWWSRALFGEIVEVTGWVLGRNHSTSERVHSVALGSPHSTTAKTS
jgi:O-antigen/teichoic acid export membrane protein